MEKILKFKSFDGLELEGTLNIPNDKKLDMSVILVHGIQTNRDEYGFYSRLAEFLSNNGISSFRFDHRANEKYIDDSVRLLTLSGVINDIEMAIKTFYENDEINKLILIGASFGGGVSHYLANKRKEQIKSCILLAPVLEYRIDYLQDEGLFNNSLLNSSGIGQLEEKEFLITSGRPFSRAIINELGYFDAVIDNMIPTTIIHGTMDSAVKLEYSRKFCKKSQNIDLIEIEGTEHGFAKPGDDELSDPITLENHKKVYTIIKQAIKSI